MALSSAVLPRMHCRESVVLMPVCVGFYPRLSVCWCVLLLLQWMAPEVLANQRYSNKADIYSFGMVMWECCARQVPFEGLNGVQAGGQFAEALLDMHTPSIVVGCPVRTCDLHAHVASKKRMPAASWASYAVANLVITNMLCCAVPCCVAL